ncbi:MAG: energy transducer TonB [Burkholderiales bacterium]|nr:energy transducer TonB [Burkholderiales bacterium]
MQLRIDPYRPHDIASRLTGLAITVLLHAGAIALLLAFQPVRSALTQALPIMVRLVTPPAPLVREPEERPRPLPVKPQPKRVEPRPEPVLLAAETLPPAPVAAPAPQTPAPPVPAPIATPPAPQAPLPIIPPSFSAAYLDNPPPSYPRMARRMGHQGKVVLRVLVNADGRPDRVELRTGSGQEVLDAAALQAVRQWKFVPARQGDTPVAAWVLVPIVFMLEK